MLNKIKKIIRKIQFYFREKIINKKNIKRLNNENFTLISNDCLAGCIYHDLNQRFNSPTINFYFNSNDYIKFLKRMPEYLECEIVESELTSSFPVAKMVISDEYIYAYLLHYSSLEEFKLKWHERAKRVNYDNMIVFYNDRNDFSENDLIEFSKLNYKKVFFSSKKYNYDFVYYIKTKKKFRCVKPLMNYIHTFGITRYYDLIDYVEIINSVKNS